MDSTVMPESTDVTEPTEAAPVVTTTYAGRGARPKSRPLLVAVVSSIVALTIGAAAGAFIERNRIENSVVATVNGTPITAQQFNHRLQVAAGTQVLGQIVTDDLRLQFAKQQNAYPTDDQVNEQLIKAESQPDFLKKLVASRQTSDDIKLTLTVHDAEAGPYEQGVTVSDDDAKAFYEANINPKNPHARYYRPAEVQVAAIVTTSLAKANAALYALAAGNSFASVAQYYTQLSGTQPGGLLPPFQKGRVNSAKFPGLEKIIFGLKVDQQTPITKLGNAYWIIRCVGTAPKITIPYNKVAGECHEGALLTKGIQINGPLVQQEQQAFQKSAVIRTFWPGYTLNSGATTQP
jgi:hypothetical protein